MRGHVQRVKGALEAAERTQTNVSASSQLCNHQQEGTALAPAPACSQALSVACTSKGQHAAGLRTSGTGPCGSAAPAPTQTGPGPCRSRCRQSPRTQGGPPAPAADSNSQVVSTSTRLVAMQSIASRCGNGMAACTAGQQPASKVSSCVSTEACTLRVTSSTQCSKLIVAAANTAGTSATWRCPT